MITMGKGKVLKERGKEWGKEERLRTEGRKVLKGDGGKATEGRENGTQWRNRIKLREDLVEVGRRQERREGSGWKRKGGKEQRLRRKGRQESEREGRMEVQQEREQKEVEEKEV